MKRSLRVRFFKWLALYTVIVYGVLAAALAVFNWREIHVYDEDAGEEREELAWLLSGMVSLMPVALGVAWRIARRLVAPVAALSATAASIRAGELERRIDVAPDADELGQLAQTLNAAFDRYQGVVDRLERFSFDASHQLRTPLAAMRTTVEVCLSRPRGAPEYEEALGRVLEEVTRLTRTVEQLLTLARLAPGRLEATFVTVELAALAQDTLDTFRPVSEAKQIALTLRDESAGGCVRGVPELLREALHNVLDNALRFTPGGGVVEVRVWREAGRMHLAVSDSGPGLDAAPADRRRAVARGQARGDGHGLGLAIAADVLAGHGGTLSSDRGPHGGARFTLSLNAAA